MRGDCSDPDGGDGGDDASFTTCCADAGRGSKARSCKGIAVTVADDADAPGDDAERADGTGFGVDSSRRASSAAIASCRSRCRHAKPIASSFAATASHEPRIESITPPAARRASIGGTRTAPRPTADAIARRQTAASETSGATACTGPSRRSSRSARSTISRRSCQCSHGTRSCADHGVGSILLFHHGRTSRRKPESASSTIGIRNATTLVEALRARVASRSHATATCARKSRPGGADSSSGPDRSRGRNPIPDALKSTAGDFAADEQANATW